MTELLGQQDLIWLPRGNGASAINSSTTAGLIFGGDTGTSINNTEEFTGETSVAGPASNITTS